MICRLCSGFHAPLLRYGIRHYAHPECGIRKWGAKFFEKLTTHSLTEFPPVIARKYGLEVERRSAVKSRLTCNK